MALAAGHVRESGDRSAAPPVEYVRTKPTEWKSVALRAYQCRTLAADALTAGCYLAGTNTRRVPRTLESLLSARTW